MHTYSTTTATMGHSSLKPTAALLLSRPHGSSHRHAPVYSVGMLFTQVSPRVYLLGNLAHRLALRRGNEGRRWPKRAGPAITLILFPKSRVACVRFSFRADEDRDASPDAAGTIPRDRPKSHQWTSSGCNTCLVCLGHRLVVGSMHCGPCRQTPPGLFCG
jgi:hypothetical protein